MKTPATKIRFAVMLAGLIFWLSVATTPIYAGKKKKEEAAKPSTNVLDKIDYSKLVWPNPPAPTRVKYLNYFCCDKYAPLADKKKSSWMDRMAGGETEQQRQMEKPLFALWTPYGLAVDSKGSIYIADGKVGAIFIFNTETKELQMIKHGRDAHFGDIIGLAIDDSDRLFVSDTKLHHIVVFDKNHKVEGSISEGVVDPGGMAIDNENRFLYVADPALDQVLVYDADKLTLIRKIGTAGKKHTLTAPGQFSVPTNVAVDADGNLYVTDMYNNRVEVFDADGNFIRAWGKAGDRPGTFSRPKGIAIDADGHVWVADAVHGHPAVLHARRSVPDVDGRARIVPGAVPGTGWPVYRQEQPDVCVRAVSRARADVSLLHRRRGAGADQAAPRGSGQEKSAGKQASSRGRCRHCAEHEFNGYQAAISFGRSADGQKPGPVRIGSGQQSNSELAVEVAVTAVTNRRLSDL